MIRERIGAAALRAYPREARRTRGPEMLSTLLDAGGPSKVAFARESGSLIWGGLRERAAVTALLGTRRLIADACCQAGMIWSMLLAWNWLAVEIARPLTSPAVLIEAVTVWLVLACSLAGHDRIAGVLGLCGIAAIITGILSNPPGSLGLLSLVSVQLGVPGFVVALACFAVMARAPRTRARDARRLLWLGALVVLAMLLPPSGTWDGDLILTFLSIYGLVRLADNPRIAIACGLVWASQAFTWLALSAFYGGVQAWSAWVVAPAVLVAGAGRLGYMRRAAAR